MDKTLEIIMVAVALVIAVVIVVGLLQGQASGFGSFASNQTSSSSCSITISQFKSAIDCSGCSGGSGSGSCQAGTQATSIYNDNGGCFSSSTAGQAKANFC
jgi:hypothetical protein